MFSSGNSFLSYPLKVVWLNYTEFPSAYPVQVAFSVPKKNFKRAHDRNLIKRQMRECYRYRKDSLYRFLDLIGQKLGLMIVYIGKDKPEFSQIEFAMTKLIDRLEKETRGNKFL